MRDPFRVGSKRETKNVEYKESLNLEKESDKDELAKDASCLANSEGGTIFVGYASKPKVRPVGICQALDEDKIVTIVKSRTYPPLTVEVESRPFGSMYLGAIYIKESKHVHQVLSRKKHYVRRHGICDEASWDEVFELKKSRERMNDALLVPVKPLSKDDKRIHMLGEGPFPYRKAEKTNFLAGRAYCPVFLPEGWSIHSPRFQSKGLPLQIGRKFPFWWSQKDFVESIRRVEHELTQLSVYANLSAGPHWSISWDDSFVYGCGTENLSKALSDGNFGVVCVVMTGLSGGVHLIGSEFTLVISGYCKYFDRENPTIDFVAINLYLSSIPTVPTWVERMLTAFAGERPFRFDSLGYQVGSLQVKTWSPTDWTKRSVRILGIMREFAVDDEMRTTEMGGVIAGTSWADEMGFRLEETRNSRRKSMEGFYVAPGNDNPSDRCPIANMSECVVGLAPTEWPERIRSGLVKGFFPTRVEQVEVDLDGSVAYVLIVEGQPQYA